jgi:hypothetical protein
LLNLALQLDSVLFQSFTGSLITTVGRGSNYVNGSLQFSASLFSLVNLILLLR